MLNEQQRAFCAEYFVIRNGGKAAIAAGYAPKSARVMASKLLTKPNIQEELNRLRDKVESSKIATAVEIQERLTERFRLDLDTDGLKAVEILNKMQGNYEKDNNQKDKKESILVTFE